MAASNGKLFLGIDHTAIAVSNTDASVAFYTTLLGIRVAGESDNYGFEQEHLNNVFGAHSDYGAARPVRDRRRVPGVHHSTRWQAGLDQCQP